MILGSSVASSSNSVESSFPLDDCDLVGTSSAPEHGLCTALKKNGERCTNEVNLALSSVCSYHVQTEIKKLRASRGSLSAISNERPKCQTFKSPRKPTPSNIVKRSKATKRKFSVAFTVAERSPVAAKSPFGNRAMKKLIETHEKENVPSSSPKPEARPQTPKANSLKEFLNNQM